MIYKKYKKNIYILKIIILSLHFFYVGLLSLAFDSIIFSFYYYKTYHMNWIDKITLVLRAATLVEGFMVMGCRLLFLNHFFET